MADREPRPVREVSHAELLRMVGRRAIRRRPSFGQTDRQAVTKAEESMEPHRGMTPRFDTNPGPKFYVHFGLERVSFARWSDTERCAVTRFTYPEWAVFCQDQGRAVWRPGAEPLGSAPGASDG